MPQIITSKPKRAEWVCFCLLLVLGASLRLGWPDNYHFGGDSVGLSMLALKMVHGRGIPLLGINSSVHIPNPPISVYLLALPFALSDSPMVATLYVALLSTTAVGLLYVLARRYYGPNAAIVAGFLYAVSPRAIIYSRMVWQQDLLPLFVVATVGTGLLGFLEGKRWAQLLHLPLLSVTGQIHYATIVLIPISLILLVAGRRRLHREMFYGLVLAALLILPFILGVAQSHFLSTNNTGKSIYLNGSLDSNLFTLKAEFGTVLAISGELQIAGPRPENQLFDLLPIAVLISALWLILRCVWRRDSRSPIDLCLLVWLCGTAVIFGVPWTAVYLHYMVTMLPGAFLVVGVGVGDLIHALPDNRFRLAVQVVGGLGLSVLVITQTLVVIWLISTMDRPTAESVDQPLGYYMKVRQAILARQAEKVLVNLGPNTESFATPELWNTLLFNGPAYQYQDYGTERYPVEKAVYLSTECNGKGQSFWLPDGTGCYAVDWRSRESVDLSSYSAINQAGLTFATGARLIAYRWEPQRGCVSLAWKVQPAMLPDAPPGYIGPNYVFTVRFYNADKTKVVRVDDMGWQGDYLQVGDIATKSFCIDQSQQRGEDIVGLRVGMWMLGGAQGYAADLFTASGQYLNKKLLAIPFTLNSKADELM